MSSTLILLKTKVSIGMSQWFSCADPERFVRGGSTLTTLFLLVDGMERGLKCH